LYLQLPQGFVKKPNIGFDRFAVFEDVAAVFFDCDNDKDLDLFVGAGGNHVPRGSQELQHRLYFNDGKGNFEIGAANFPDNYSNTGVAVAHDFDGDGDQDLFVGGRSVPFQYGLTPLSHVYLNDGKGQFTEMNKDALGSLAEAGMVTDAVWANVDGDAKKELIVVGEWMQPRIFSFNGQRFTEIKSSLADKFGWWQSVTAMDIDGDNDMDLVLGNLGENFYLGPDSARPVKIYINDFDGNSTADVVITQTLNGKDVPVFLKRELTEQMPSLKKQALKHHDYAGKSISELVKPAQLNGAIVKTFNYASSCIAVNLGNGRFEIRKLPVSVQLSSVNAVLPVDVNRDGRMDLVMGGNEIGFLPQFSRIDASYGNVLINQGNGSFTELPPAQSGLEITGVVRDMKTIAGKGKNYVLILRNNESPILYSVK
jgi:enediyne biosynthesis protein E4